jgi:hypothetical protein
MAVSRTCASAICSIVAPASSWMSTKSGYARYFSGRGSIDC